MLVSQRGWALLSATLVFVCVAGRRVLAQQPTSVIVTGLCWQAVTDRLRFTTPGLSRRQILLNPGLDAVVFSTP